MPNGHFPLLIFPGPAKVQRSKLGGGGGKVRTPDADRQQARIAPQLAVLEQAFEAKRIQLQQAAPLDNPELVLVLEVVGTVANFAKAVSHVPGLEWLLELAQNHIPQDEDFHEVEERKRDSLLIGRLYLLGTNREALDQLLALWGRYQRDRTASFARGLAPFKHVFEQLRTIRPWDASDRVDSDMRAYWVDQIESGQDALRFEIEAWYSSSAGRNETARNEIQTLVRRLGGDVLSHALIAPIAYHGLLVELPAAAIQSILEGDVPELLLSERIMFFRPRAQSITDGVTDVEAQPAVAVEGSTDRPPIIALLDGLPLANHTLLADRLIIDDPDGWEAGYEAKDRVHGTAMASLILHGELDGDDVPLGRKLYVRPVMRPEPHDGYHPRRIEQTPDDVLLIDLMHRAVKRICEGDAEEAAVAPSVKIINLSMGDAKRIFARDMSPWARLLDWLSYRYAILFIVSAGNDASPLTLETARGTLAGMPIAERQRLAFVALTQASTDRRLMAPAESINALTVGAMHADSSRPLGLANRFDLFTQDGISPLSRIGHGYRRAIKPDVLMPGGRALHMEQYVGMGDVTVIDPVTLGASPGHRVAVPPLPGGTLDESTYSRGTSNAAALTSRAAARAYDMLDELRAQTPSAPNPEFDAVILKALLVHGASWGDLSHRLLGTRPDIDAIADSNIRRRAQKDFVTRWLGYGPTNIERAITCTEERATLLGVGALVAEEALVFSAPLPPSLAGKRAWRRITVTLAWLSPTHPTHQMYRRARLWISDVGTELRVNRENSVDYQAAMRGTVQHEVFEGEDAVPYVDGNTFACKVNCAVDAGAWEGAIRFALCVSLEVSIDAGISVYQEIRDRIMLPVGIQPI